MNISFPAMEGLMGGRKYYACLMKLSAIPKMFSFRDWAEFTPEQREQRVLNKKRIPDIAKYVLDNEDGYLFSSITASYKCDVRFDPTSPGSSIGHLSMEFEDANFVINDGQHRCAAIAHAIKANPALGDEMISVLLFRWENIARVQQMFSDLNRYVTKTSKSLDILYDKRDSVSQVTLAVVNELGVFDGLVDKDAVTLPTRSAKLFTLSSLYDATSELLGNTERSNREATAVALAFWSAVATFIPAWSKVKDGFMNSMELRQEQICAHSVVLRALGSIGGDLLHSTPDMSQAKWEARLDALKEVDWRKTNPDWDNICIVANSVVSNRQARTATKAYLKRKLDLELNEAEKRALGLLASDANAAQQRLNVASVTTAQLAQLYAALDDTAAHHVLWVGFDGGIHIDAIPADGGAAFHRALRNRAKFQWETWIRGNNYVGPLAAADETYIAQQLREIKRDWERDARGLIDD